MMRLAMTLAVALAAGPALAQDEVAPVDPRAVEECAAQFESFTEVERCLGRMHVAHKVLDAVAAAYGEAGETLISRCAEVNPESTLAAKGCAVAAIDAALRLASRLPAGTEIKDPLFAPLSDANKRAQVEQAEMAAREAFPERTVWTDPIFKPLK